ncbi:glycosyl transferase [Aspergillus avenaceus]|uniref:Glycosyl transferase n=1 Tax=Aspergillus avenaceus TaxID=36643 RepID=A0A5N6U5U8_ASPAV|nr:glycosyl transferase [Aspergillus avenaceus]
MFISRARLLAIALFAAVIFFLTSPLALQLYLLLRMPFVWRASAADSVISYHRDRFDLTFRAYNTTQLPSESEYPALVPARLHHVHLGGSQVRPEWLSAREECLKVHPGWEAHVWDDATAGHFVRTNFPELYDTWENYPYLVQKVDALRYMVLYKFGGVILDLDLVCKRSLEPLRRFDFVAPAAHPAGFSIGMLLSSPNNSFVGDLIHNLPRFNRRWLLLPYATVMFSTGCHYASTIYTMKADRSSLRILSGPPDNPTMHMLNGLVDTPLFRHLGTSSWHANDALFLKRIEREKAILCCILFAVLAGVGIINFMVMAMRRRSNNGQQLEEPSAFKTPGKVV